METSPRPHEALPLFVKWTTYLKWQLDRTEKFPKKVRFTFSSRLDNIALDVLERIIEATYTKRRGKLLRQINLDIDKLRVLLRICHELAYLPTQSYKHAIKLFDECGRMAGGWGRHEEDKP